VELYLGRASRLRATESPTTCDVCRLCRKCDLCACGVLQNKLLVASRTFLFLEHSLVRTPNFISRKILRNQMQPAHHTTTITAAKHISNNGWVDRRIPLRRMQRTKSHQGRMTAMPYGVKACATDGEFSKPRQSVGASMSLFRFACSVCL
jgi:hypothetical protein